MTLVWTIGLSATGLLGALLLPWLSASPPNPPRRTTVAPVATLALVFFTVFPLLKACDASVCERRSRPVKQPVKPWQNLR
jgi:hypothetical protein